MYYIQQLCQHEYFMFQDTHYFSDTEHGMMMGGSSRMEMRRIRNRTLSGLESVHRMGGGMGQMMQMGPHGMDPHLNRPGSAGAGSRPITPSFSNDKDPGQQFIDFNPAGVCHDQALFLSTWRGTHASTMSRDVPDIHGDRVDFCQWR